MTEKEKMLAGEVYSAIDPELIEELLPEDAVKVSIRELEDGSRVVEF